MTINVFSPRSQKENLKLAEAQEEQRLLRCQKQYIELEMRKFRRKKMISLHDLETQLLRDVSCLSLLARNIFKPFFFVLQELSKKQQQLEQAHGMLLKHHEKTQDLEYRQQKSVHALREEQVSVLYFSVASKAISFQLRLLSDFKTTQ